MAKTTANLEKYRSKRDFSVTGEPEGSARRNGSSKEVPGDLLYVIQKHQASHLHYDFRLEWRGVLLSWAIPKGPSLDPSVKRLAARVEDHPVEYGGFEGGIPEGEYGGGTVMLWDRGTWTPEVPDVDEALRKGELKFTLNGKKLKGSWVLVRTKGYGRIEEAELAADQASRPVCIHRRCSGEEAALGGFQAADGRDRGRRMAT